MIKQVPSADIKEYVKNNPKSVLIDVRTEEEWNGDGKPDGDKIGINMLLKFIKIKALTRIKILHIYIRETLLNKNITILCFNLR